jgi:alpha-tubulin suppressor-like RCC1 family protein
LSGVVAIGTGTLHSCAYVSPTELYCWGGNDFGQLGIGDTNATNVPTLVKLP